jgi:hypothetical protein
MMVDSELEAVEDNLSPVAKPPYMCGQLDVIIDGDDNKI